MKIHDLIVYATLTSSLGLAANNLNAPSMPSAKIQDSREIRVAYIAENVRAVYFPMPSANNDHHTIVIFRSEGTYDIFCNYLPKLSPKVIFKPESLGAGPKAFEEPPLPLESICNDAYSKFVITPK